MSQSVPVRIRLRYADLDTFIEKFAPNVTRGGVFLASRHVRPAGTIVPFEIQIATGDVALAGEGKVIWVRPFDPAEPNRPYGMGVQFVSIDPGTKPVLARLLKVKDASGRTAERRATGAFVPLELAAGSAAATAQPPANGRSASSAASPAASPSPPIDTSVDLAAEFGLEDTAVRRVINRIWMLGLRLDGSELDDLLRPDPAPTVTLAQALNELPRLLDPQSSRRRMATGAFRPLDMPAAAPTAEDEQSLLDKLLVRKD